LQCLDSVTEIGTVAAMGPLPPPLAALERRYLLVRAEVESGRITPAAGMAAMSDDAVVDPAGRRWRVDLASPAHRALFVAAAPGEQERPTEPSEFGLGSQGPAPVSHTVAGQRSTARAAQARSVKRFVPLAIVVATVALVAMFVSHNWNTPAPQAPQAPAVTTTAPDFGPPSLPAG
jgi:hypothetical protein